MKIVQTFWTGDYSASNYLNIKSGWISAEYHWLSWALSCLTLRRYYDQVELYTDQLGKKILVDLFKLPYTKTHLVFDESSRIRSELFSLAKIKTYSLQNERFIHVDGDVYIWNKFPMELSKSAIIASNLEENLFFNKEILRSVYHHRFTIPEHLRDINLNENIYACNAGVFGGGNIDFIKEYCDIAYELITVNSKKMEKLEKVEIGKLNWLIEQISLYYLAKQENIPVSYLFSKVVTNPLYEDFWRFCDIPSVPLIHPVGGCKKERYVLQHLLKRLRLDFPSYFYSIIEKCKKEKLEFQSEIYSYITIPTLEASKKETWKYPLHRKETELKILEKKKFKKTFSRTLNLIRIIDNLTFNNHSDLSDFVCRKSSDDYSKVLSEIYELEKQKFNKLSKLLWNSDYGKLHSLDVWRYKKASKFFMSNHWMETNVAISEEVEIYKRKWDWEIVEQESDSGGKRLQTFKRKKEYTITLHPDILNLDIIEIRHEGLDALVLESCGDGTVRDLALILLKNFENDITIQNRQYQQLLFDTIKRMAFETIIELR